MTETAKERIYREALEKLSTVHKPFNFNVEYSDIAKKALNDGGNLVTTDKLSVEKLQEQLNTAKKALTEISKTKVPFRNGCFHWEDFSEDALKAQKALAAIEKGENNEI